MKLDPPEISLQEQIATRFRNLIRQGMFRQGQKLPTVRQVAKEMSISITPAITAFAILEKEGLVHSRQGSGTYVGKVPIFLPKSLDIGVLFREPTFEKDFDMYGFEMFLGVQNELQKEGHRAFLVTMRSHGADARRMAEQFKDLPAHGYVLDEYVPDDIVEQFVRTGRPVVVANRPCDIAGAGSVSRDGVFGGRLAVEKMTEAGHRQLACVHARGEVNDEEVRRGFELAAGKRPDVRYFVESLAVTDPNDPWIPHFDGIMRRDPRPTAILFSSDRIAFRFADWAESAGFEIPRDVSIVGNLDMALAPLMKPPLTTIRFDPRLIGSQAVREVIRACHQSDRRPAKRRIAGAWVERQTLARVASPQVAPEIAPLVG